MEVGEHQVTPLNEEKSFDETTVFGIGEDGSISKRRRRKSQGRRVSFAEATSLHIFPRDDEYETPTRGNDGASPHRVGERRSPRLAAKMRDADKENRDSATAPGSHRTRNRAKKPLAVRAGCSPALKPENWLDPRDSSKAGDDEENTGPVDLRHLSFDKKDSDTDEDNMTLDSTTFAMKLLEDKLSVLHSGFIEPGSDMSITEQVPARKRKIMQDIGADGALGISIDQGIAVSRTSDNSGSAVNSQDAQTLDMSISSVSVSSIDHADRSITLGIPSFKDLIREEEEDAMEVKTHENDCEQDTHDARERIDPTLILENYSLITEEVVHATQAFSCAQQKENELGNLKISVEEFLQLTEVQLAVDRCSPNDILKDHSLAETHHVSSLSESFQFLCLVKPQLQVMRDACEELYDKVQNKANSVEELEGQLTASNPAIFFYFQKAPEWEKQRMRKQLEGLQSNLRLLAEQDWLHFQRDVEMVFSTTLVEKKNLMLFNVQHVQEVRNTFDEKCRRPLVHLQASLASKIADKGCPSNSAPAVSEADVAISTKVASERIKDLMERVKNLESSKELKIARLRKNELVTEDTLRGLKERVELSKNRLVDFGNQVVDNICMGQKNLVREEIALRPYDFAKKMKDRVCLLHQLQDGFQVKSAGKENLDQVVELSYRSLLKRRYVVRKVGNAVNAISSSWALDSKKIDEMFPDFNAVDGFRLALTPTYGSISKPANLRDWKQTFGQVSALEAARFTLPKVRDGGNPEGTDLRASMQTSRILVGHLMELMDEVGKCQRVVNASCGGGVLAVSEFQNESDGKPPQLELKMIDCLLSVKFFVRLDMSCLPLTGYPFGELPAEVEIIFCAPTVRHLFKKEPLEAALAGVAPGRQRLKRTYAAVGALLASIRSMITN